MQNLESNFLENIEQSYFISPPEEGTFLKLYKEHSPLDINDILKVYNDLLNSKGQYGFSRTKNITYLRMFKALHYERGGYVFLPLYLTKGVDGIQEVIDPKYKFEWEIYNNKCSYEGYKRLTHLSYNHIFPDGKIMEFVFDENRLFKWSYEQYAKMFNEASSFRAYCLLDNILDKKEEDCTTKVCKKLKI